MILSLLLSSYFLISLVLLTLQCAAEIVVEMRHNERLDHNDITKFSTSTVLPAADGRVRLVVSIVPQKQLLVSDDAVLLWSETNEIRTT